MIKFFRNIRKNLLSEGKTGKYLKYAIGEIILVVIGILIALQVNNWNQKELEKKEARILLKNLQNDFQKDTIQLQSLIKDAELRVRGIDSIAALLKNVEQDDLNKFIQLQFNLFNFGVFQSNQSTYDEAISSGTMKLLANDDLKYKILTYYRRLIMDNNDQIMTKSRSEHILPYLNNNIFNTKEFCFGMFGTMNDLPSLDLKALSSNQDYFGILVTSKMALFQIGQWRDELDTASEILKELNKEIEK